MGARDQPKHAEGEERRVAIRHFACFPAHVERANGSPRSAIIHDVSVTGVLLFTRAKLEVGEIVGLKLYLSETSRHPRATTGAVLRTRERAKDHAEVWPFSVAVRFDEELDDCEAEILALARRQRELGLAPPDGDGA